MGWISSRYDIRSSDHDMIDQIRYKHNKTSLQTMMKKYEFFSPSSQAMQQMSIISSRVALLFDGEEFLW